MSGSAKAAEQATVVSLWPNMPPGFQVSGGPEADSSTEKSGKVAGQPVIRLAHVSQPQLHIYAAPQQQRNGTALVVCPGGGFNILAWDLEGTEIAQWFNSQGVTVGVLKYRVPTNAAEPNWQPPVQDAQRAISLLRSRASELGIIESRIGVLGFSAGGKTAAMTALKGAERQYPALSDDPIDAVSCRADFAVLIYPAYLVEKNGSLKEEIRITKDAPPTFLAHAFDDPIDCMNSVQFFAALKQAGVRSELHVYSYGGHGYGARPSQDPVTSWNSRCADWLKRQGWLDRPKGE